MFGKSKTDIITLIVFEVKNMMVLVKITSHNGSK